MQLICNCACFVLNAIALLCVLRKALLCNLPKGAKAESVTTQDQSVYKFPWPPGVLVKAITNSGAFYSDSYL